MNLLYLHETKLGKLKRSIENNRAYYQLDESWLDQFFESEQWQFPTNINVQEFSLKLPVSSRELYDFENTKTVYSAMKTLSISEATDERLWAHLTHVVFWEYMSNRWPVTDETSESVIRERYFFTSNRDRSLVRNGLARLWWYGYASYDETRDDPFELTKILLGKSDVAQQLLERSLSRNATLTKAILSVLAKREKEGMHFISREEFRQLSKYINFLGGVTILDALSQEDLMKMIGNKIESITK